MDSWEWNKIAGAASGVLLFILVINNVADALTKAPQPPKPGYAVDIPQAPQPSTAAPQTEPLPNFGAVLPAADANHGKDLADRCQQCHDTGKNGANRIGPNLWGVVDRPRASYPGYAYSSAMNANRDPWSYDKLYVFLRAPGIAVPGSKMGFGGLHTVQDRLDLLAYLRTLNDTPAPFPDSK